MKGKHTDARGIIEDLKVGDEWSVTYITIKKGAVRGNHFHKKTTQLDIILSGRVLVNSDGCEYVIRKGESAFHRPGVEHAYLAIEDTEMISICNGVRVGENYSKDTFKSKQPLL